MPAGRRVCRAAGTPPFAIEALRRDFAGIRPALQAGVSHRMQFGVDIVRGCEMATLLCRGRLVVDHGVPALRDAAHRELSRGHILALDLGSITQMDASGVGVLAELCGAARTKGRGVVLVGATDRLRFLLHLTRLDTLIPRVNCSYHHDANPFVSVALAKSL